MTTNTRLTPRQRLTRGLTYTAVGPFDITRGTLGLGAHAAHSAGAGLRRRYSKARIAALQEARQPNRRRRRLIIFSAAGLLTLAAGAVAFSIIRRSSEPEPSPRPPSVEVTPKP